jgi:diaminohydroxyphosphoribosylaminopyrimidine deaminase/5-amino-6-(5-phosphoribosylamino)uracil reductase
VGIETVLADDPMLTGRPSRGKQAARIVLDNRLRIPGHSKLIRTAKKTPVIILAWQGAVQTNEQIVQRLEQAGAEILAYPDTQGRSNLYFLLDELSNRGITQLLVEGGPRVIASFLRENLADEFCIYIAPKILGSQGGAGMSPSIEELVKSFGLDYVDIKRFGDDVRITGFSEKALNDLSITQE